MSNPLFKHFKQQHFTAGTRNQFDEHRSKSNPAQMVKALRGNFSSKFYDIESYSIDDTFDYIFNKFKKGIFIQIRNNQLTVMLPFSKVSFRNEWHPYVQKPSQELLFRSGFKRGYRMLPFDRWYANNGLIRYDGYEGESGVAAIADMFTELCDNRKIPDCEFFVNKRDFPLLREDGYESYDYMFGRMPLVSHKYEKYAPILSMCTTGHHADIPIPTWDDWGNYKAFPKSAPTPVELIPWEDRRPIALFRGSLSGLGTTSHDNPRLKLYSMRNDPLLDIGITKWNTRLRKCKDTAGFAVPDIPWDADVANFMPYQEQCQYKYLINVDGHSRAYCLTRDLATGCCVLLVLSDYKLWYTDKLKPFVHYVPVMPDLSNLMEKVRWCRDNDDKCREIANNARRFYEEHLSQSSILDYLQTTLTDLVQHTGTPLYWLKSPPMSITHFLYNSSHALFVEQHLVQTPITGDTVPLSLWLRSKEFSFYHYEKILGTISHILLNNQHLQFNHGNLLPDYVLVNRNREIQLIAFDHSHIKVNGIHYGPQRTYNYDILFFKITSMLMILYQPLSKTDIHRAWSLIEEVNHFLINPLTVPQNVKELKFLFKYLRHELWEQLLRNQNLFHPRYVERKQISHTNPTVDYYLNHLFALNSNPCQTTHPNR